ncbi:MAG: tyrosine-protein phosphatase [Propionicimonas sp.]
MTRRWGTSLVVSGVLLLAGCAVPGAAAAGTAAEVPRATAEAVTPTPPVTKPLAGSSSVLPTVKLTSVVNFRDVAGEGNGLPLAGGEHMARGVVYRSARLAKLSSSESKQLTSLGITAVFDLRSPSVAKRIPDPEIEGATYHLVNLFAGDAVPSGEKTSVAVAMEHMQAVYRQFVASEPQRDRLAKLLEDIAAADGPVLVHCTAGKDRTGWVSAMLQYIAGASDENVMAEFLASNDYRADLVQKSYAKTKVEQGTEKADIARVGKEVDASYLQAGLDEVAKRYGDLDGYLRDGLGLTDTTISQLESKLRVG